LILELDRHAFLGFDRLMESFRPSPARHRAAGEFVDYDNLAVLDHIFDVALEQGMRTDRGIDVMHQGDIDGAVETVAFSEQTCLCEQALDMLVAHFGQEHLARFLVDRVVTRPIFLFLSLELRDQRIDAGVEIAAVVSRPGNDQRRARFVDQNRVDLVDYGIRQIPLHPLIGMESHVVAQIIEAELVVRPVRDRAFVGALAIGVIHAAQHDADGHVEGVVDLPHPLRVATRQIIVDRDDVHGVP